MRYSTEKFMLEIGKCKDPVVFLGVCRVLGVGIYENEDTPRTFADLFADVLAAYKCAPRKFRKDLFLHLKQSNKEREEIDNGSSTENS